MWSDLVGSITLDATQCCHHATSACYQFTPSEAVHWFLSSRDVQRRNMIYGWSEKFEKGIIFSHALMQHYVNCEDNEILWFPP